MTQFSYQVSIAVTGTIEFQVEGKDLEDASLKALEMAKEQFPGADKIQITSIHAIK